MPLTTHQPGKRPLISPKPYPWKCVACAQVAVMPQTIRYEAERHHEGMPHRFVVEHLSIPICAACGEKIFTVEVDRQINSRLREHLRLLSPQG